jgi:catechol 2,3-dioxygenase-like lactoylglutathione lyase family enzyme
MFDHIGLGVASFRKSRAFYAMALAPLGIAIVKEGPDWAMLGKGGKNGVWFGEYGVPPGPIHIAFAAETRAEVRAFYAAAIAAGGKGNGAPGLRAHYHPNYYGAYVFDPDGHNIEAVCHRPE